ncbi:MAG: hypothetical protein LWX11_00130 [Firmicutes bacterium]|nr:hypothetical protein [Bacillota bacterium]
MLFRSLAMATCAVALLGQTPQDAPWQGQWKLASTPDLPAAIEQCTASMSFVTRPIARSRLKKLNPPYSHLRLTRGGTEIQVQFEERAPIRMPADGRAVSWTREDGERFMVSVKTTGDGLIQHYQGEDGARENRFRLEGGVLVMEVTVTSGKLPKPLTYVLKYVR